MSKIISLFIISLTLGASAPQTDEFRYSTILDHDNRVQLEWNVDKAAKTVRFKLAVVALRRFPFLIGFGASDRGLFTNADLVVFEIKSRDSNVSYLDCYTDRSGVLKVDKSTDYTLDGFKVAECWGWTRTLFI